MASYPSCYGVPLRSDQLQNAAAIVGIGKQQGASPIVQAACIYAAYGENNITVTEGNGGMLQTTCNLSAYNNGTDRDAQIVGWYTGGECFGSGGGLAYGRQYDTIWQIANAVEENAVWSQSRGDSYARGGWSTSDLEAEVANTYEYVSGRKISYSGSTTDGGGSSSGSPGPTVTPASLLTLIEDDDWSKWYAYGVGNMWARSLSGYLWSQKALNDCKSMSTFTRGGGY